MNEGSTERARPREEERAAALLEDDERPWLIYGAYGFTGRLIAREARDRGHRPVLAGRDRGRVEAIAGELGLPHVTVPLDDPPRLRGVVEGVRAVCHAAGPFNRTAPPMLQACLDAGSHYLDITGEAGVLEFIFALGEEARRSGIALLPGVGANVVPTDALAAIVARNLPEADALELAVSSSGSLSPGTAKTVVEHLPSGLYVRRDGKLRRARPGAREFRREIDFGPGVNGGIRTVAPYTWGDLSTALRTTGIANITCYNAMSAWQARTVRMGLPVGRAVLYPRPVRAVLQRWIATRWQGADAEARQTGHLRAWGRASAPDGHAEEAIVETMESYRFTAVAAVRAVEELLDRTRPGAERPLAGALTPAGAFGPEWVLSLPETRLL